MKLATFLLAIAGVFFAHPKTYTDSLRTFNGDRYLDTTCSALICNAHNRISELQVHCKAKQLWEGCEGNLTTVLEADSLVNVDWSKARAGDVLAVNGVHVIAYLGNGQCIDSDPLQNGVKEVSISALIERKNDAWFAGPVRVQRWVR